MLTVDDAIARILHAALPLPGARTPLLESPGRVLDEDIVADIDVPPFSNSAVDGYAVRAADTARTTAESTVVLRSIGDMPAGASPGASVGPGEAVRIMTGAAVPQGADAVVMVEDTAPAEFGGVRILAAAVEGQHVRRAAQDVERGSVVLTAGTRIRAAEVAMLATMGRATVLARRRPRVAVFSTGDELVDVTVRAPLPVGKIRDSNRYALAALVEETGATLLAHGHIPDDLEATVRAFRQSSGASEPADVLICAGGVSVGDRDFVKPALERLGTLDLWRVRMKPGKPLAFGRIGDALFFGLPGNPVSAMVTFELFVRPALLKMAGRPDSDLARPRVRAVLAAPVAHSPGRREFVRAITKASESGYVTRPTGAQGSHILRSMTSANSLIIVPEDADDRAAGSAVEVMLLTSP